MNVPEAPFVLHLPNVMHLATDVTGVLAATATDPSLLAWPRRCTRRPPSAAPRPRSPRQLIAELEGMDRGPVRRAGRLDGRAAATASGASRCAAPQVDPADPHRLRLFAGCGIVAGSDPEAELAESEAKLVPMRDALVPGEGPRR